MPDQHPTFYVPSRRLNAYSRSKRPVAWRVSACAIATVLLICFSAAWLPRAVAQTPAEDVAGLIAAGREALAQRRIDAALDLFNRVIGLDPTNAEAYYQVGVISLSRGDIPQGIEYLGKSVSLAPDNMRLRLIFGKAYEQAQRFDEAIAEYRLVVDKAPGSPEAIEAEHRAGIVQGKILGVKGDFAAAELHFKEMLERSPGNVEVLNSLAAVYLFLEEYDKARALYEQLRDMNPTDANVYLSLARLYEKAGESERETEALKRVLELDPNSRAGRQAQIALSLKEGVALFEAGDTESAKIKFEKVVELDPGNAVANYHLGFYFVDSGDSERAEQAFRHVVEAAPDNLVARLQLARIYLATERIEQGVEQLNAVIAMGGESSHAQNARQLLAALARSGGASGQRVRQAIIEEEIRQHQAAIAANPDDLDARGKLGTIYLRTGKLEEAREQFSEVVRIEPTNPGYHLQLAAILERLGEHDAAAREYAIGVSLTEDADTAARLGETIMMIIGSKFRLARDYTEAIAQYEAVLEVTSRDAIKTEALFYIALAYVVQDELDTAVEYYLKALELNPGNVRLRFNLADAYTRLQREEDAIIEYRKIIELEKEGEFVGIALRQIEQLEQQIKGFSYFMNYSMVYDNNINLSAASPARDLRSSLAGSISYRRKLGRRWRGGVSFEPSYTVFHAEQFDGLRFDLGAFATVRQWGWDYTGRVVRGNNANLLLQQKTSVIDRASLGVSRDTRLRPLLQFAYAPDIANEPVPTSISINLSRNAVSPITIINLDSTALSLGVQLRQQQQNGVFVTGSYDFTRSRGNVTILNDNNNDGHRFFMRLEKVLSAKLSANTAYGINFAAFTNPDPFSLTGEHRANTTHTFSLGASYRLNNEQTLIFEYSLLLNQSNLPVGFILGPQDTIIARQSSALGDYRKDSISVALQMRF